MTVMNVPERELKKYQKMGYKIHEKTYWTRNFHRKTRT
jgi:hypothetical protein